MHMVAAVVLGPQARWMARVTQHGVEIDHRIEGVAASNPLIHRLPLRFAFGGPETGKWVAFEGIESTSIDSQPLSACAIDDLSVRLDHLRDADLFRRQAKGSRYEKVGIS